MKCEFCKNKVRERKGDIVHQHINIQQDPIYHFFCSRECKMRWMYNIIVFGRQLTVGDFF